MTFAQAKHDLNQLGMTITRKNGEYRVTFLLTHWSHEPRSVAIELAELCAYYSNDLVDAYGTAQLMSKMKY